MEKKLRTWAAISAASRRKAGAAAFLTFQCWALRFTCPASLDQHLISLFRVTSARWTSWFLKIYVLRILECH